MSECYTSKNLMSLLSKRGSNYRPELKKLSRKILEVRPNVTWERATSRPPVLTGSAGVSPASRVKIQQKAGETPALPVR